MLVSREFGLDGDDDLGEQGSYAIDLAMARFGYAVADLTERDRTAVIELVERLAGEIREAHKGGRGAEQNYTEVGTA